MDLQTISEVTRSFNISTRTLRYYEQIGLIESVKKDGYAYRTYDKPALTRLEQILLLRKLRISLKDIQRMLLSEESSLAIAIFQQKIRALAQEAAAISTIQTVLDELVLRLRGSVEVKLSPHLWTDESILEAIAVLPATQLHLKEEVTMKELQHADNQLSKLKDVRIIFLPPAPVASICLVGGVPELATADELREFVIRTKLDTLKPDMRHYGFNHPDGSQPDGSDHGYERWITIPADMEVEAPFVKKQFPGGLYAAHMIPMGSFEEWEWLHQWVMSSREYEADWVDSNMMNGLLEEHLNYINLYQLSHEVLDTCMQLDLLIPVKPRLGD
ncbi:effector binding domain-containing protein [Paenibacillus donghaensis]|uniref:HTH merR-type domain-containing protein n=1 Tax=Paenibacillus donghaensis TaxID=414771 RepID=A0A2Z2KMN0_9BACL|nr:effector binding domain-containing protein [Paenibacillus donghaensis]ASA24780.1 hypothetical protein B9T62_30895 [Paenibacillus donghaensis]